MIIAISGNAGSGKSTLARKIQSYTGFQIQSLAHPIKALLARIVYPEKEEGVAVWLLDRNKTEKPAILGGKTVRYALQTLGTEWGRDIINPDIWATMLVESRPESIIVDDVRFVNEINTMRLHDKVLHIHCNQRFKEEDGLDSNHGSESEIEFLAQISDISSDNEDLEDIINGYKI